MRLNKDTVKKAVAQLESNGAKPPFKMYVDAPYQTIYGMWRIGVVCIRARSAKKMWKKYKKQWRRYYAYRS